MRFKGLDLNILQALDVLLDERHVSRTADRLNVTQPAMSGILTRLREYFNDPLLVQHGKRMIPTAHALALQPKLKQALSNLDVLLAQLSNFDVSSSERTFKVIASDYVVSLLFPEIAKTFSTQAPNLSIEFSAPSGQSTRQFEQGGIDLMIVPEYLMKNPELGRVIYEEEQVALGCANNPVLESSEISEEDFFAAGHVVAELGGLRRESYVETFFSKIERKRRVAMRVPSFLAASNLLQNTNLLTVTHKNLALFYAEHMNLSVASLPFSIPPMKQSICYHQARQDDPGVQWLLNEIINAGANINKPKP
jgi:DNA-binding transcriptional LysR family regulator